MLVELLASPGESRFRIEPACHCLVEHGLEVLSQLLDQVLLAAGGNITCRVRTVTRQVTSNQITPVRQGRLESTLWVSAVYVA